MLAASQGSRTVQGDFSAARQAKRKELVTKLLNDMRNDKSIYALTFPEDEDEALELIAETVVALDEDQAVGTIKAEASAFRKWIAFCEERETMVWRDRAWVEGDETYKLEEEF